MINNDERMIELLIKHGADPEIFNEKEETPVFYATAKVMDTFNLANMKAVRSMLN